MKSKTLLISAISLGALIMIAGCEGTTTPTGQTGTPAQSATTSNTVLNVLPGSTQTVFQPQISQADQAAYDGALQLKDPTFCDKITDEAYRKACQATLADQAALSTALEKLDASLCSKLSTSDKQEACKIQVEVAKKAAESSKSQQVIINSNLKLYTSILDNNNYADCDKLTEPTLLKACKDSAIVMEAEAKNDINICNQAKSDTDIANCRTSFEDWSSKNKSAN